MLLKMTTSQQKRKPATFHNFATSWLKLTACCFLFRACPAEHATKALILAEHGPEVRSETDEFETTQCSVYSSPKEGDLGMWAEQFEIGDSLLQVASGQRHKRKTEAPRVKDDDKGMLQEMPEMTSDNWAAESDKGKTNSYIQDPNFDLWEFPAAEEKLDERIRKGIDASSVNRWSKVPAVEEAEEHVKVMEEIRQKFNAVLQNEKTHSQVLEEELAQETQKAVRHSPLVKSFTIDKALSFTEIGRSSLVGVAAQIKGGDDPRLTVDFYHKGRDYSYELFPESVYTEAAQIYDGDQLMQVEEPKTFQLRDKGRWASITWHDDGGVQGLLEADGYVMKVSPVSRQAPQVAHALLQRYEGRHAAHLIRWVALPVLFQQDNKSHASARQPNHPTVPDDEASHIPNAEGRNPWVEDAAGVAGQDWGGVRWHPRCYSGDDITHELVLGFVADKAARDLFDSKDELQKALEFILHEASFVFEMQMNIKLKLEYLKMSNDETEFDGCKKKAGEQEGNRAIAYQKLELMHRLTGDGTIPWHAANHFFTGCADGAVGTVGLAFVGTGCRCCQNVGVTLLSPHENFQPWDTFAHELGHNFNGSHSFEEGQGKTGGIMDYGDGKLNGHYQFNTKYRKTDMCGYFDKFGPRCTDKSGMSMFRAVPPMPSPDQAGSYIWVVAACTAVSAAVGIFLCLGSPSRYCAPMFGKSMEKPTGLINVQGDVQGLRPRHPPKYTADYDPRTEPYSCFPCC